MTKLILKAVFSKLLLLALLLPVPVAMAQSGTRNSKQAHYDVLWSWVNANNYKQWNGVDGRAPSFQEGDIRIDYIAGNADHEQIAEPLIE